MKELGALLHEARVAKGLSLEDLEDETKIKHRYLESLEDGEFDSIPGEVYLRGFLRSYARAVDLDPGEVITQYEYFLDPPAPIERGKARKKKAQQRRKQRLYAGIIALLAVIALLVWLYY